MSCIDLDIHSDPPYVTSVKRYHFSYFSFFCNVKIIEFDFKVSQYFWLHTHTYQQKLCAQNSHTDRDVLHTVYINLNVPNKSELP